MRRKDREVKSIRRILEIVDQAKVLHLGLFDKDFPYIVPLHYGYTYSEAQHALTFYMHCAREGHKLDLIQSNPHVCIELECDTEMISGGDTPCNYGAAYASVIGNGQIEIVDDPSEKIKGLRLLMLNQTGREFRIDEQMASCVTVLKVTLLQFSAKERQKPQMLTSMPAE